MTPYEPLHKQKYNSYLNSAQQHPRPHPAQSWLGGDWLHSPAGDGAWHRLGDGEAPSLDGMIWNSHIPD